LRERRRERLAAVRPVARARGKLQPSALLSDQNGSWESRQGFELRQAPRSGALEKDDGDAAVVLKLELAHSLNATLLHGGRPGRVGSISAMTVGGSCCAIPIYM